MQVDPVKSTLKAPGTERLKLEYKELLSNFGFNFSLRRYTEGGGGAVPQDIEGCLTPDGALWVVQARPQP